MSGDALYHKEKALRSVSIGTALRFLRYPFLVLSVTLIPRFMGDSAYGEYAYYLSILVILDVFSDLGYMQIFGRFMPEAAAAGREQDRVALFHHTLVFALSISAAIFALFSIAWLSGILPDVPRSWLLLLGSQLILTQAGGILYVLLYGQNKMVLFSAREVIRSAATFLFVSSLFGLAGLNGALWGLVLTEVALVVTGAWWARDYLKAARTSWRWSFYRPYIVFGLQFYIPAVLLGLLQRSGNILIKRINGSAEQVAYYDLANQFLLIVGSTLGLLISTLIPVLTSFYVKNEMTRITTWHRNVISYSLALALLALHTLIWLGEPALRLILGAEFAPVMPCAIIMSLALAPCMIGQIGVNYSILKKQPRVYTAAIGIGLAGMLAASVLLIPQQGARGAALATLAGYSLYGVYFVVHYFAEFRPVLMRSLALVPFLVLVPAGAWIEIPDVWRVPVYLGSTAALIGMMFLFKVIDRAELSQLTGLLKKK